VCLQGSDSYVREHLPPCSFKVFPPYVIADREEVWDNFGKADKPMVYGHASDYLAVKLERKVRLFTSVLWHKPLVLAHITFK